MRMRKVQDEFQSIVRGQFFDVCTGRARTLQHLLQIGESSPVGVDNVQFAMKALGISRTARNQRLRIRAGSQDYENALLCSPSLFNAVSLQVIFKLMIDNFGGEHQGEFSEPG